MPSYLITDNETGRKFKVTGDSPPTEAEAAQLFADMGGVKPSYNIDLGDKKAKAQNQLEMLQRNPDFQAMPKSEQQRLMGQATLAVNPSTAYDYAAEPFRFASEAGTATLNALGKGLKSAASVVQGGAEAIRQGNVDSGMRLYNEKMAEFKPVASPLEPSQSGQALGYYAQRGIEAASNATGRPDIVEPVAQGLMDVGALVGLKSALPYVKPAATSVARAAINLIPKEAEMSMYKRGIKGQTGFNGLKMAELDKRVNTALDEGIKTTPKGVEQLKDTVNNINNEIKTRIADYAAQDATVNVGEVIEPVGAIRGKVSTQAFPEKATTQVNNTVNEFKRTVGQPVRDMATGITPETEIPLAKAQAYKQSINSELQKFYDAMNRSSDQAPYLAQQWVMKTKAAIGDGLRNTITEIFPESKALNAREGALLQLNKSLERAVNRIGQRDILSLKFIQALSHSPVLAFTEFISNNPALQSSVAVMLRSARNKLNSKPVPSISSAPAPKMTAVQSNVDNGQRVPLQYPEPVPTVPDLYSGAGTITGVNSLDTVPRRLSNMNPASTAAFNEIMLGKK